MRIRHATSKRKATHSQLRRHNQQLLLRTIYSGLADNRAALAKETGLTKPTVSELISELLDKGLLEEGGKGGSTDSGGRRPRLLKFVPTARHVIGVSLSDDRIQAVLSMLDGQIVAQHALEINGAQGEMVIDALLAVINGLIAQLDAPLLCIGVGVAGLVDARAGIVHYAPHLGLHDLALADRLSRQYGVPVYLANDTELAAMAQYVYDSDEDVDCLVAILVGNRVGAGLVIKGEIYHGGGDIGHLLVAERRVGNHNGLSPSGNEERLETFLGWAQVKRRISELHQLYPDSLLPAAGEPLTYLHIRHAIVNGDPAALQLQEELSAYLAQVFAWTIALIRPDHISLVGHITNLGQPLLDRIRERVLAITLPDISQKVTFSLANSTNLVAIGAVAQALQLELGLV